MVDTHNAPAPNNAADNEAHNKAMADKVAAAGAAMKANVPDPNASGVPSRPDSVPEKFWNTEKGELNTEALLKSYTELEKARTPAKKDDAPALTPDQQAAAASKVDMAALTQEMATNGTLSEQTYTKLDSLGFDKTFVDGVIATLKSDAERTVESIKGSVGSAEAYDAMVQWASHNLSDTEREAFNESLKGSSEQIKLAVQGLNARYKAANPDLLSGGSGGGNNGAGSYASRAEWLADVNSANYKTNEMYRQNVARKAMRSNLK